MPILFSLVGTFEIGCSTQRAIDPIAAKATKDPSADRKPFDARIVATRTTALRKLDATRRHFVVGGGKTWRDLG